MLLFGRRWGGAIAVLSLGGLYSLFLLHSGNMVELRYPPRDIAGVLALAAIASAMLFGVRWRFHRISRTLLSRSYENPVSGLPNRYKLLEDIRRSRSPALALVKAERFNEINSCFGHGFGDRYIVNIQQVIEATLNHTLSGIMLYHVDRDTFAILQEHAADSHNGNGFTHRFSTVIGLLRDQTFSIGGLRFPVPVTAGIASGTAGRPELLYNQAEQALTAALYAGRSEMIYADSDVVRDDIVSHTSSLALVAHAIQNDRVEVAYQPIMKNRGSSIEMYEALVRIRGDDGDLVLPGAFLHAAKLSSYHKELTRIVFQKTFSRMKSGSALFNVNISMENIVDEDFLPFLEELMQQHTRCKGRCILEITESEGVENYEDVRQFIEDVKKLGYRVAIDDFGSGYSNFANIIRLPVDYIKFDGELVQAMNTDARALAVLTKMTEIAHELKIKTIAEFVDSKELLTIVRRIKVDYAQGYLVGKPAQRLVSTVKA
jgi:EAL domain-containing protein (putative c-di-GMP-specific phosphodiesterase class I)/GGDEF domain-containing protein